MNEKEFNDILNSRLEKVKNVLAIKAKEYVRNEDRLHNFNVGARLENKHPTAVLHGMMLKHYISYLDILKDIQEGKEVKRELIDEKIGDLINYLILQECVFISSIKAREKLYSIVADRLEHEIKGNLKKLDLKHE